MKYKVQREEFKKVVSDPIEVIVPEEPRYYWHNGIRKAYCIVPEWTSWNREQYGKPEEIWQISVIEIDPSDNAIRTFNIHLSQFTTILSRSNHEHYRLIENFLFHPDDDRRSKEQFMADYEITLENIAKPLQFNGNPNLQYSN